MSEGVFVIYFYASFFCIFKILFHYKETSQLICDQGDDLVCDANHLNGII